MIIALIPYILIGWIPAILVLFSLLPPRRAVAVAFVFGWLFLPHVGFNLPGLPNYSKLTSTSLGTFLATTLFCSDRLFSLRPRWFDLPIATWCLCPIASSLSNGLGLYDGLSVSFDYSVTWGLPYLVGRVHFTRLEHLRELAVVLVYGGLVYIPLCIWELRMGPDLHLIIYGVQPTSWGELSFGGYRPRVFMSCALEVGLFMCASATTGVWLWASGAVKQIGNVSFGWLLTALLIIAVLCKVMGAVFSLTLGVSLWFLLKWSGSRLPALALVLLPVGYMTVRSSGLWTGETAVQLVRSVIHERRAESLAFRMKNEDMLVAKALVQPAFGWGGWSRARVYDEATGRDISVTDGLWVIAVGNNGLVGLISFYSTLLLPMVLLVRRYPARAWQVPSMVPACALATMLNLYSIDCIANAFVNPIYILSLGGVMGTLGALDRGRIPQPHFSNESTNRFINNEIEYHSLGSNGAPGADPREAAAMSFGSMGRSLMEQGLTHEAEEAWRSALQHWAELAADHPDDLEYRKCWLDALNDSAWSLISLSGPEARNPSHAIQLAEQAVELDPGSATYWNTLGIAYFRAGDWKAAIHALGRSTELNAGGTSFDFFFLAMASWQQGDGEQARRWYARANSWMAEHNPEHADLLRFRAEASTLLGSHPLPV